MGLFHVIAAGAQLMLAGFLIGISAVASAGAGTTEGAVMTTTGQSMKGSPDSHGGPFYPFFAMDPSVRRMPGTVDERLDTLKRIGYDGLSINDASLDGISRVMAAAEARDMKVYALYLSCTLTTTGITLPAHFDGICEALGRHGAVLWLYVESKAFKPSSEEGDAVAVPALQAAADRAAAHGVRIALYHHHLNWAESFADAIRVADKVDRANFGVSFNLCHALRAGEEMQIPDLLRQAAPRLFMASLNGADSEAADAGWERLIRPLGQGSYDPAPLLELLEELDYPGAIGFQAFGIPGDPVETLRTTMEAWRGLNR